MTGSEHNDEFYMDPNRGIRTRTNRSGGIQVLVMFLSISKFLGLDGYAPFLKHLLSLKLFSLINRVEYQMGKS